MKNRKTVSERVAGKTKVNEFEKMMQSTTDKLEVPNSDDNQEDPWKNRRQTYYIPEVVIDALQIKKAFEDKDISEIVREALIKHIDDKYIDMAKDKYR